MVPLSRPHQDLSFPPRQCRLRQLLQQALLHAPMQHAAAHHQAIHYQAAGGEAAEGTGHQAVVTKPYKRCWKSLENGDLTLGIWGFHMICRFFFPEVIGIIKGNIDTGNARNNGFS